MTGSGSTEDLLEFPCRYQFKAVGVVGDTFKRAIVAAVERQVAVPADSVHSCLSGQGNYQSVSIRVTLDNYRQLTSIYAEMRKVDDLKMLL